jgi:integrase
MQSQRNGASAPTTDAQRYALDPTRRWSVEKAPGIYYRLNAKLERAYLVHHQGKFVPAGPRLSDAKAKQAEYRQAISRGKKPVLPTCVTLAELAAQWWLTKQPRLRPKTQAGYRSALDLVILPRFGSWRVATVDADAISDLVRDLQARGLNAVDKSRKPRALGKSSVENYLKPLHAILKLAVRRNLIGSNPFDCLTADDRPRPEERREQYEWSPEAVQALLEGAKAVAAKTTSRYDYTPLLRLAATTGLRLGEVLGLRWEDFGVQESVLYVRRQWTRFGEYAEPKTKAGVRRLAIPGDLRAMLIDLKLAAGEVEGPIFASKAGTPLMHRNVTRRGFEPARDEAKLPRHVTFHSLRHAAASRLIGHGLDPVTVASILGHDDPNVTMKVYAHLYDRVKSDDRIRAALQGVAA